MEELDKNHMIKSSNKYLQIEMNFFLEKNTIWELIKELDPDGGQGGEEVEGNTWAKLQRMSCSELHGGVGRCGEVEHSREKEKHSAQAEFRKLRAKWCKVILEK